MKKLLLLLLFPTVLFAQSNSNYGFEDGNYANWLVSNGITGIRVNWGPNGSGAQISDGVENFCVAGGFCWSITPHGQYMLSLQPGSGSPNFDTAATSSGLSAEQIQAIRDYIRFQAENGGGGNPNPTNATFAKTTKYLEAGTVYTYAWNYLSTDYEPFNDGSLIAVTGGPGVATVNNQQDYALLGFTNTGTGNYATGSYGSTGWQLVQFTVTVSGNYDISFMVFNMGDTALSPILFIDEITGETALNGESFAPIAPNEGSDAPVTQPTQPGDSLCCGGSSQPFDPNAGNTGKVDTFEGRTSQNSMVFIDQVGSDNTITVQQSGTEQNYFGYVGNGNNNTITSTQSGGANTQSNYIELFVTGDLNDVDFVQTSSGGRKGIFANINDNNNTFSATQTGSGSHYLDVFFGGGNKTLTALQEGNADHMAIISLLGEPTSLEMTQSGDTQRFYSISHTCVTAGGCGTITVTQGP